MHLLIVEPDRTLLATYCAYFVRAGFEATTVTDIESAKEIFLRCPINMVILEPDFDDNSDLLLETIADRTQQRPLPVIVVSRRSQVPISFPVHGYHVKPVRMATLLENIFSVIHR